jgi:hypothetical protein
MRIVHLPALARRSASSHWYCSVPAAVCDVTVPPPSAMSSLLLLSMTATCHPPTS